MVLCLKRQSVSVSSPALTSHHGPADKSDAVSSGLRRTQSGDSVRPTHRSRVVLGPHAFQRAVELVQLPAQLAPLRLQLLHPRDQLGAADTAALSATAATAQPASQTGQGRRQTARDGRLSPLKTGACPRHVA